MDGSNKYNYHRYNYFTKDESDKLIPELIAQKVIDSIYTGITTELLDLESAKICTFLSTLNPLYSRLAGIILVNNLHKTTTDNFVDKLNNIHEACAESQDYLFELRQVTKKTGTQ